MLKFAAQLWHQSYQTRFKHCLKPFDQLQTRPWFTRSLYFRPIISACCQQIPLCSFTMKSIKQRQCFMRSYFAISEECCVMQDGFKLISFHESYASFDKPSPDCLTSPCVIALIHQDYFDFQCTHNRKKKSGEWFVCGFQQVAGISQEPVFHRLSNFRELWLKLGSWLEDTIFASVKSYFTAHNIQSLKVLCAFGYLATQNPGQLRPQKKSMSQITTTAL